MPTLVAGAGAAAIGGMISDIDSGTSQAHREADKIMTAAIAVTAIVILADYKFHVGIYERLMRNSSIARLLTGAMAFIIICTYGSGQPHRSFMHSFLSMFMLTACMDVIYPDAAPYFAIAYASHLALDMLNYSGFSWSGLWNVVFPEVLLFPGTDKPPAFVCRYGLRCPGAGHIYSCKRAGNAYCFLFTFLNNDF